MYEGNDNLFTIEELKWTKEMVHELEPLTKEQQGAVLWLIYHIDFLDIIASGRIMTEEEEREWTERAINDNDYILQSLIQYKKTKDQNRAQKTKNPS